MTPEAIDFLQRARDIGCEPIVIGEWIQWDPPLPTMMTLESIPLNNDIGELLNDNDSL